MGYVKYILIIVVLIFTACKTAGMLVITDEMVKPILDSEISLMHNHIEDNSILTVLWCDDQRFALEKDGKIHVTRIAYWIRNYIEQELTNAGRYTIVTRTELDFIFEERSLQFHSDDSPDNMTNTAIIVGARYLIIPVITRFNTLSMRILDSESGRIVYFTDNNIE